MAGLCTLASMAVLLPIPRLELGNDSTHFVVRLLTAPFVHGFGVVSTLPHLAGNLFLLLFVGSAAERLLGTGRFALLTAASLSAYAVIQIAFGLEVNGASVFIWGYAPIFAAGYRSDGRSTSTGPARGVLFLMWVVIPILMTAVPYTFGWSGSLLSAFVVANAFHLSATAVGFTGAWFWRTRLVGDVEDQRARLTGA